MAKHPNPLIIAHRGASFDAPENTMSAFSLAWEQGADGIECDVQLTQDGVLVCHHDPTTLRQSGVDLSIAQSKYKDLAELNVASFRGERYPPETLPKLTDVLSTLSGDQKIFVEVKTGSEAIEPLLKDLKKSKVDQERVTVIAFDSRVVFKLKQEQPSLSAYWLDDFSHVFSPEISEEEVSDILETCRDVGADGIGVKNCAFVTKKFVQAVSKKDLELNVWTVDDPDEAARYRKWGVSSISSNMPGLIRSLL